MSEAVAIEQALRAALGAEQYTEATRLAQLLADVARGVRSPDSAGKQIKREVALRRSLARLNGRVVETDKSVLSFGEASQVGDVTIDSVVGNDQITLHINYHGGQPTWPLWLAFSALAITVSLALGEPSLSPAPPTSGPTAAAVTLSPNPTLALPASVPPPAPMARSPTARAEQTFAARTLVEDCIARQQLDVANERIFLMEAGANIFILGPDERRDQPIALALSEDGQPLALVVLDIVQGQSYIARAVLDAGCQPLPDSRFGNAELSRLHMLQAWDNLLLCLASGAYRIRVGDPGHTPVEILSRLVGEGVSCPL